jgi:DNA-binding transcriptional regulator YhcF (GntR family)
MISKIGPNVAHNAGVKAKMVKNIIKEAFLHRHEYIEISRETGEVVARTPAKPLMQSLKTSKNVFTAFVKQLIQHPFTKGFDINLDEKGKVIEVITRNGKK